MKSQILIIFSIFILSAIVISQNLTRDFVELYLDKNTYVSGENLNFYGKVVRNFFPVKNKPLGIEVISNKGVYYVDQIITDKNGEFNGSIKLNLPEGNYTFYASIEGSSSRRNFTIVRNPFKIEVNLNKMNFSKGGVVEVNGRILNNSNGVNGEIIAIQVTNPMNGLIYIDQSNSDENGYFNFTFKLPENAVKGRYLLFLSTERIARMTWFYVE